MFDALEERDGKVSIVSRNITYMRFSDDTDPLAEELQELEALVGSLDKIRTRYRMKISAEKTKLVTKSAKGKEAEAGYCNKLQVPWSSCLRWWL